MSNQMFSWESIGDLKVGRPNLGTKTEVAVYRLMQYTMRATLAEQFGDAAARKLFQDAGKRAGIAYCNTFLDRNQAPDAFIAQLNQSLLNHGIGILRVEEADLVNLHLVLTVSEDLDCSGLPVTGEAVCDYDEGFIAGILELYIGKEFNVKEVDCWATGDRTCRFDIRLKEAPQVGV